MGGNQTTAHSDRSIDSIWFWTTKFWLLKIFGWCHPSKMKSESLNILLMRYNNASKYASVSTDCYLYVVHVAR